MVCDVNARLLLYGASVMNWAGPETSISKPDHAPASMLPTVKKTRALSEGDGALETDTWTEISSASFQYRELRAHTEPRGMPRLAGRAREVCPDTTLGGGVADRLAP